MKPISFLATARPDQSRHFYENVLGLEFIADESMALVFRLVGHMLRIQKVEQHVVPKYTAFGFEVDDIEQKIQELKDKGVQFEQYSSLKQDDLGIWKTQETKIAWFKDPDDNTISLTQFQ